MGEGEINYFAMKIISFFLLVFCISCYSFRDTNKIKATDYDRVVNTDTISFFGGVKFINRNGAKKYSLFYKSDSLKYFSVNLNNRKRQYIVDIIKDSLLMLSTNSESNYYSVDTMIFFKDKCVRKGVVYNYQHYKKQDLEILGIAKTSYTTYLYGEKELKIYSESFYNQEKIETLQLNKSILNYVIPTDSKSQNLNHRNIDSIRTKYENKEKHKLNYFY